MHIPYGMLDHAPTLLATNALAVGGVTAAFRKMADAHGTRLIPLLGSTAAFVFAAQMVNFPVAAGVSGHLIGGTLAATLLGPWGATAALTVVLVVQCLLFADGGLLELGANVINMAVIGGAGAWCLYRALTPIVAGRAKHVISAMVAAWVSVVASSACCAVAIAAAGTARFGPTLAAMIGIHSVIGIGEAAITGLVVATLLKLCPELIESPTDAANSKLIAWWPTMIGGTIAAFVVAAFLAPVASDLPDGLEAVAVQLGFADRISEESLLPVLAPDYESPGLKGLAIGKSIAGIIGIVAVAALSAGVAWSAATSKSIGPAARLQ